MIDFTSFFITAILLTTLFIHIENKDKEVTLYKKEYKTALKRRNLGYISGLLGIISGLLIAL